MQSTTKDPRAPTAAPHKHLRSAPETSQKRPGGTACGDILALPPGRHKMFGDLKRINSQCYLMVGDMHKALVSKLIPVPAKLLNAAETMLKPGSPRSPQLWRETLILYVEALGDSREQLAAAGKLHAAMREAGVAIEAINSIEKVLPSFLFAAEQPLAVEGRLVAAAGRLGEAAGALGMALSELLAAIERTIAQTKALNDSAQPAAINGIATSSPKTS